LSYTREFCRIDRRKFARRPAGPASLAARL